MNDIDYTDYSDAMRDARRGLLNKRERLCEEMDETDKFMKIMDATDDILDQRDQWKAQAEELEAQLTEAQDVIEKQLIQIQEMSKLAANVAGRVSQDDVLKVMRTFIRKSKQKRLEKRVMIKEIVLEMALTCSIELPDDLRVLLNELDDEHPVPSVTQVMGNYNDIHDNDDVKLNDK